MKITTVTIHNFRSVKKQSFQLSPYSLLIGPNNSGKTNIIDALRIFYEKDLKFAPAKDSPKIGTDDKESWLEIEFRLTDDEFSQLKDEYRQANNTLRVRKYLRSEDESRVKANQSNIYAYENGSLSGNLFYGAKNISEAKLGDVIYIPEVTKVDEYTKLTGPSAFRSLLEFVVKKVVKTSDAFAGLTRAFEDFNVTFREEAARDGVSLKNLLEDINKELRDWEISFGININQIKPEEIIKSLVSHYLKDPHLAGHEMDITSFGQGFQRHLIYTLIKLSIKYKDTPVKKAKKEFAPAYTLVLFEEPEAFLHPAQQGILDASLKDLSAEASQQVLIASHSSHFVSKNIEDLPAIIKLTRPAGETKIYQVDDQTLQEIFKDNKQLKQILEPESKDNGIQSESIRYCLWLDPDRCCSFFADMVLICEGLSEKALIDALMKEGSLELRNSKTYILNAGGKHDIHRYMNLFGKLGIKHSVLFDGDNNSDKHKKINEFIQSKQNASTIRLHCFEGELEDCLGIPKVGNAYRKPINVMWHYRNNKIERDKIDELVKIVTKLIDAE